MAKLQLRSGARLMRRFERLVTDAEGVERRTEYGLRSDDKMLRQDAYREGAGKWQSFGWHVSKTPRGTGPAIEWMLAHGYTEVTV